MNMLLKIQYDGGLFLLNVLYYLFLSWDKYLLLKIEFNNECIKHTHILLYISFMIFFLFGMILIKTHTHTLIFIQVISSKDHFICFFHMEFGVVFGNIGIKSCSIMGFEFIFFWHNITALLLREFLMLCFITEP